MSSIIPTGQVAQGTLSSMVIYLTTNFISALTFPSI